MKNERKDIDELIEIKNLKSELKDVRSIIGAISKMYKLYEDDKNLYKKYAKRELQIMNKLKELGDETND